MKLLSLCSLLLTQVFAAPVSIKEGSASLIQAINEIENSSNYKFTYLKTMMAFFSGYLDNFDFNKYPNLTMVLPTDAAFKGFSLSAFTDSSKVLNFVQYYALRNHYDNSSFAVNQSVHLTTYSEDDVAFYKNSTGALSIQGKYDHNTTVASFAQYKQIKALIVEKLIYPPESFYETAKALGLTQALNLFIASGISYESLKQQKNFTIFLPTEDAITALVDETCKTIDNIVPSKIVSLLAFHTTIGKIFSEAFPKYNGTKLTTLNGESLDVEVASTLQLRGSVNGAKVIASDLLVKGGVIHIIDSVLVPADYTPKTYCVT